jgi:hypothetical protein
MNTVAPERPMVHNYFSMYVEHCAATTSGLTISAAKAFATLRVRWRLILIHEVPGHIGRTHQALLIDYRRKWPPEIGPSMKIPAWSGTEVLY